jgi:hypothetical protein
MSNPIKYLFSINAGRSGSDYLTELLSKATNSVTIHEGAPIMNGRPMQQFNEGDEAALRALMPAKMKAIQRQGKNGRKIYCETNHSYIKGWGYLLPDEHIPQEEIGVIILRRDTAKTAYSLLRVHDVPGASAWGRLWYLTPGAKRNLSQPPAGANPYELCCWYVEEVNRRGEEYQTRFPRIRYLNCTLEQLNDLGFVTRLFDTFGLIPSPELAEVVGKPLNIRHEWPALSLEELIAAPRYPSADSLPPAERSTLVAGMVAYLHQHKAAELSAMRPDIGMGGTMGFAATTVFSQAERALEDTFHYSLMFTDTEWLVIGELLRSVHPADIFFLGAERTGPPNLAYEFEFNEMPTLGLMVRRLGAGGTIRALWLILQSVWGRDFSHRESGS